MKKMSKLLSIILAILMVMSIIPLTASAEKLTSGTYRDITWTFDESTGTLTISGTGKMYDDVHSIYPTWHGYISSIESVVISEGVTTISDSAFCNNENIKNVSIADSVTDIGDEAFYNCTDLTNVVIGDGVTTIGYRAFYNCDGLTDVVIGKGVTVIDDYAFNACSNLKTVTIYNAVETIGEYSFNCPKLTDVYYFGTEAEWNAISKGSIIYGIITGTGLEKATIHFLGEETHECSYNAVVTPPTCTEQGYTTYTCVCGDSYVADYVDALGHIEETVPAVAPTCTETGLTAGAKCSVCGETLTEQKELPANGHTPANAVEENYITPTCTENGSKDVVVYCSVCDEEISRETVTLDATGHTYTTAVTAPTCTEQGYTTYTCNCGETYIGNYVNATGHADNDGDGYCDADNELLDPSVECDHHCHKSGFTGFIWKVINFFNKLFGLNKNCDCSLAHY